jgi:hypothetical protein
MATLSATELQAIRSGCAGSVSAVTYTKAQANAAAQAVEDFLTNNAATVSTAINTATSPLVLSAAQKKALFAQVVFAKYLRDK